MQMSKDEAMGMFMGLFVGDAMGAPLEFTKPNQRALVTSMIGGGVHKVSKGEWTDDGAMAMCIADAYISKKGFNASAIQKNFIEWKDTGKFGTRNEIFDIGMTVMSSLNRVTNIEHPYTSSTNERASGNGCLMRMAPCIVWNKNNLSLSIGESVAQSLLTHGSSDCITYTSALAHELFVGKPLGDYDELRNRSINNSGYVADTYASAWHSVICTNSFYDAIVDAINRGGDADTVGAVTGMIAGRIYGFKSVAELASSVHSYDLLLETCSKLLKH